MAVAEILAGEEGKMNGVTMTRSGKDPYQVVKLPPTVKERLRHFEKPVDVRDAEGVLKAMKEISPSVVVYAASASKQGGNSFDVDDKGVENVARACKDVGAKFILISALAVDRPDSKSFKITNTIGGYMDKIMDAKLNGEMKTREIMGKDYIIIRPGVLLSGKSLKGAADIELNQGDTIGGGLSRDELAGVVMGAIQSGKSGITVEAYRTKTATKLEPELPIPSGNELKASSYSELFANSKSD
jgi:dTDP-4-dehydrorhamnose reductase